MNKSILGAIALTSLTAFSAQAHHSYAPEFGGNPVSYVEGVITDVSWLSPHVSYQMEVTGGMPQEYQMLHLQSQAPSIMQRSYEVTKDFLNIGDHVAIKGRNSTYGNNGYQIISISVNGGEEFALQSQGIPEIGAMKEQTGNRNLDELDANGVPVNEAQ